MKSLASACFALAFIFFSIGANGQDESEKIDLSAFQWLSGKWEGSGYANPYFKEENSSTKRVVSQNFELSIQCSSDSISIRLTSGEQKEFSSVYLNESQSDIPFVDERFEKRMRILYLHPMREGGRWNDRELLIHWVNENHISISLTYYARPKENLILHGVFQRVKKP